MFRWQKEMDRLDLQVKQILNLQRSLNRIQLGLPGYPSQEATAYLCVFAAGKGVRAAVILHLHISDRLAIFLNEEGELPRQEADPLARKGADFAESMGFMVGELDWPTLSNEKKGLLWESLPLKKGPKPPPQTPAKAPRVITAGTGAVAKPREEKSPPVAPAVAAPTPKLTGAPADSAEKPSPVKVVSPELPTAGAKRTETGTGAQKEKKNEAADETETRPSGAPPVAAEKNAAAVIEAKEPPFAIGDLPLPLPLRRTRQAPTPEAMEERRRRLRENLGRFLASL